MSKKDFLSIFESRASLVNLLWNVLPAGLLAVVTGWGAAATELLAEYTPAAYVLGGIVGIISYFIIKALIQYRLSKKAEEELWSLYKYKSHSANPMDQRYLDKVINISELMHPVHRTITGKDFIGCRISGPATIIMSNSDLNGATFVRTDMILINDDANLSSAILLDRCNIRGGEMIDFTILIPRRLKDHIERGFHGEVPWVNP